MKTLDASVGYRLVWALDRLGVAHCDAAARRIPAPYQSTAQWPRWMEPAGEEATVRVIDSGKEDDVRSDKSGNENAP
jgi:hypothetical protein